MNEKIKRLSIGQFAALHRINKKTLMWYDEKGIFQPAKIDPENGYRYYSYQQSTLLETILMLRELGLPLKEIGSFVENRSAERMEQILGEQLEQVEKNIQHLYTVLQVLASYRQDMRDLQGINLEAITLVEQPEKSLITIPDGLQVSFEKGVECVLTERECHQIKRMYHTRYGSILPVSKLYEGDFEAYSSIFMECVQITEATHIRKAGIYLQTYCKGDWDRLPARYEEILVYAAQHGIQFEGNVYETGINAMLVDSVEDYITKIEIPVRVSAESG